MHLQIFFLNFFYTKHTVMCIYFTIQTRKNVLIFLNTRFFHCNANMFLFAVRISTTAANRHFFHWNNFCLRSLQTLEPTMKRSRLYCQ